MVRDENPLKTEDAEPVFVAQDFDDFMAGMESDTAFLSRKRKHSEAAELTAAFGKEFENLLETAAAAAPDSIEPERGTADHISLPSSNASPRASPFESIVKSDTSVSTEAQGDSEAKAMHTSAAEWPQPNMETVSILKRSMASSSRLIGTFTALKSTYMKLCKEFNFLLGKFNENERIKIELIHENNELRKLLYETIKEKELDRKRYKADLLAKGKC